MLIVTKVVAFQTFTQGYISHHKNRCAKIVKAVIAFAIERFQQTTIVIYEITGRPFRKRIADVRWGRYKKSLIIPNSIGPN